MKGRSRLVRLLGSALFLGALLSVLFSSSAFAYGYGGPSMPAPTCPSWHTWVPSGIPIYSNDTAHNPLGYFSGVQDSCHNKVAFAYSVPSNSQISIFLKKSSGSSTYSVTKSNVTTWYTDVVASDYTSVMVQVRESGVGSGESCMVTDANGNLQVYFGRPGDSTPGHDQSYCYAHFP